MKQINNKALLASTWNYTQYLVRIYNGKESEKEQICIYVLNPCPIPETINNTVNQLHFNFFKCVFHTTSSKLARLTWTYQRGEKGQKKEEGLNTDLTSAV